MDKRIEEHLETLKAEIASDIAERVAAQLRTWTEDFRRVDPEVVTKSEACFRLGIKPTKLRGMLRRGEISPCIIGDAELIPVEEIRRLARPIRKPVAKPKSGGRKKKTAAYDPLADYEALGRRSKKS